MRFPKRKNAYLAVTLLLCLGAPAHAGRVPDLRLRDIHGHRQKLSALRGQIVVLSFWATWCPPCEEELPRLSRLSLSYAGKDVRFVAVSVDDAKDREKIEPFLTKQHIHLDVWLGGETEQLRDFGLGYIVPGTVILDGNGEVVGRIMGEARDEDVRSRLDWLLGGRTGPAPESRVKRY